MSDKNGLSSIRHNLSDRANAAKSNRADADAQKIRGPVTLVLAGLRGVSRMLAAPLSMMDPMEADNPLEETGKDNTKIPTLGYMAKMIHTLILLILSALVYVAYTNIIFTRVTDANTFIIVSTLAWMMCLLLILWLAT